MQGQQAHSFLTPNTQIADASSVYNLTSYPTTKIGNITSSWAIQPQNIARERQHLADSGTSNLVHYYWHAIRVQLFVTKSVPPHNTQVAHLSPLQRSATSCTRTLHPCDNRESPWLAMVMITSLWLYQKMTYRKGVSYVEESKKCT